MKRFFLIGLMLFSQVDPALADSVSDKVFAKLREQGYIVVQQDRTWLGRIWVLARSKSVQREVVFDPTTGEILRDYAVLLADLDAKLKYDLAQEDGSTPVASVPNPQIVAGGAGGVAEPVVVASPVAEPVIEAVPTDTLTDPEQIFSDEVQTSPEIISISP